MRTNYLLAAIVLASGCEFFPGSQDGAEFEDGYDESDSETDGGEPPPSQGFRVYPKFMLQDLPAIVTIELDGVTASPCELDGAAEGGYLCDAGVLAADSSATIRVDKDGFDSAVRHPVVVFNQIVPLEVHLAVEGGPTGSWSACTAVGEFETCADLCATVQSSCVVTSCATEDPEWPVASYQTFTDAECTMLFEDVAQGCESPLPLSGSAMALRCCCAP